LRRRIRMNAVRLHERIVLSDAFHEKLDPWYILTFGGLAKHVLEGLRVPRPVIAGNADPQQHDGRARRFTRRNDFLEIAAHAIGREAPEAIVATELEDNQRGLEICECRPDPLGATLGRFAADTGVDDAMFVTLFLEP